MKSYTTDELTDMISYAKCLRKSIFRGDKEQIAVWAKALHKIVNGGK